MKSPDLYTEARCSCCGSAIRRLNGRALKYERERQGLSRECVADAAGVSASLVAKVEEGVRTAPYSIVSVLGLSTFDPGSIARRRFKLDSDFDSQKIQAVKG